MHPRVLVMSILGGIAAWAVIIGVLSAIGFTFWQIVAVIVIVACVVYIIAKRL